MKVKLLLLVLGGGLFYFNAAAQKIQLSQGVYEGSVLHDTIPHGKGKLTFQSGEVLQGVFAHGSIHGGAEITFKGNTAKGFFNVGDLSDAEINVIHHDVPKVKSFHYKGNIKLYRVQKMVMLDFLFGNHVIEKSGHGRLTVNYVSGDTLTYEGMFLHDKQHGQGKMKDSKKGFYYQGHFENGEMQGSGMIEYTDGGKYKGGFAQGEFMGRGYYKYPENSEYEYYNGFWQHGLWHGRGRLTYKNGGTYSGDFFKGEPHGNGKRVFADGSFFEGTFVHGKPTKATRTHYTGG